MASARGRGRGPARRVGGRHYLLGHSEGELRRLDIQGDLYHDITRRALRDAGIEPGMRVLDIGCGTGAVSVLVGEIVGPEGSVLGIDGGDEPLEAARARAGELGLTQVSFERREIEALDSTGTFDAVVGRFVLMHQARPAEALASAVETVRDGGIVVMIESYMELLRHGTHSEPHSELYDRVVRFQCDVVRRAGADLRAGGRLPSTFAGAGLPPPTCRLETRLESGPDSPYYEYVAESVRSMLPEAARTGIGDLDADPDTLEERLRDQVVARRGALLAWPAVSAWART